MRFKTIFLIFALSALMLTGIAWADDDDDDDDDDGYSAIKELQATVVDLQAQVDYLNSVINDLQANFGDVLPPIITHDAPSTMEPYSQHETNHVIINFEITDDTEVAYCTIQDDEFAANNYTLIAAPGLNSFDFVVDRELHTGLNSFTVMAVDRFGNITTSVVQVELLIHRCEIWVPYADLSGCDLQGRNLSNVDLTGANLTDFYAPITQMDNIILEHANLTNAYLAASRLGGANLHNANLTNANLQNASLGRTDLSNANMTNTYLYNASIWESNLTDVIWDNTTCPDFKNSDYDDGDGFTCLNNLN